MNNPQGNTRLQPEYLLTSGEVSALLRVDRKTVRGWAATGKLDSILTPGGHRRFRESVVLALLNGGRS